MYKIHNMLELPSSKGIDRSVETCFDERTTQSTIIGVYAPLKESRSSTLLVKKKHKTTK